MCDIFLLKFVMKKYLILMEFDIMNKEKSYNKSDIIDGVAKDTGMKKADVEKVLDSFKGFVANSLKEKAKVVLIGFITFYSTERAASKGRNPKTGKEIDIKASTMAKVKVGQWLKNFVNNVK